MDIGKLKAESAKFNQTGDAFIHVEMKDGKAPRTLIAGGVPEMLWCITGVLHRISELTHMPAPALIGLVGSMFSAADVDFQKLHGETVRRIQGEDWQEQWKESTLKRETAPLQAQIGKLQEENKLLRGQIESIKRERDQSRSKLSKEQMEHRKEILALEHRMQEIIDAKKE